ncbi:wd40 repeat-like protein [Phaffia rhodozyma]|uniref:Autophagy-related protein 18 n=1 Tax=Phaffia rhodozyma TaxID=264483 RepID=A0A0F7SM25_PHARH|nr:wd40 repeat-like protein [Phaffia rhodozyma]
MAPTKQNPDLLDITELVTPLSASLLRVFSFAGFNQDYSCISIGTKNGYTIINCDPYGKIHSKEQGATGIAEMLFCTSLVALVGAADQPKESPRRLHIVNTKRESTICELLFPTSILAVKLNRKRMVVVLEVEIYIYDVSTMKLMHTIETSPNPNAICALSPSSTNSYVAYPAPVPTLTSPLASPSQPPHPQPSTQPGDVNLFDTTSLSASNVIQAHKSPISFLVLNSAGTLLATASDKGTVIRVWTVPGAEKVAQFRRGSYPAKIWSINFNLMSTLLAVSSDSDTIHIFQLPKPPVIGDTSAGAKSSYSSLTDPSGSYGVDRGNGNGRSTENAIVPSSSATASFRRRSMYLGKHLAGSVGGYLPSAVTEMWEPQRDFAHVKLRGGGVRCVVALSGTTPQVFVISASGLFHAYSIDLENGGECVLMKEFR